MNLQYKIDAFKQMIQDVDLKAAKATSLFSEDSRWSAADELVLLAAINTTFIYQNWNVIAVILEEYCNKKFTPEEIRDHYNSVYVESDVGKAILESESSESFLIDHTVVHFDEDMKNADIYAYKNVSEKDLAKIGYMPLRGDFLMEYKPDSESLLNEIRFTDDTFDKNYNLVALDTYRKHVQERIVKKKVIRSLRLVEKYFPKISSPTKETPNLDDKFLFSSAYIPKLFPNYDNIPLTKLKGFAEYFTTIQNGQKNGSNKDVRNGINQHENHRVLRKRHSDESNSIAVRKKLNGKTSPSPSPSPKRKKFYSSMNLLEGKTRSHKHFSEISNNEDSDSSRCTKIVTIEDYPWGKTLTAPEKKLCVALKLRPMYYIYYKAFLLYIDTQRQQGIPTKTNMIPASMTVKECAHVVNFLKDAGYIQTPNLLNMP